MLTWYRLILSRLTGIAKKQTLAGELSDELRVHHEMLREENMRRGMSREEADRHANMSLGNATNIQERYRDQAALPFFEVLWQDLRYAVRLLRKSPGFTAVAIITLALGIGANTAIFSVVNGVLLRPLPYEDPAKLMFIFSSSPSRGLHNYGTSPPDFRAMRERNHTLAGLSGFYSGHFNLTGAEQPELLPGDVVSAEYFRTLGVQPALGRDFLPNEEQWGSHHVVVVSEAFWRTHLNSDPGALNKTLMLNGEPYKIIGVMPASFYTLVPKHVWIPMAWKPKDNFDSHNNYFLDMIGRLKPGVTQQQVYSDLNSIMLGIVQQFPENKGVGADLEPLRETLVGDVRPALMVLLGAVAAVLLIACVNLANLMLVRSAGRKKEIAIRSALGAGRTRLLRQFITESILLSMLGGLLGLVLAYFFLGLLPLAQNILPRMQEIHLDTRVLLFTFAISVLTGALFGLVPALQNSRVHKFSNALKEGGRTSETGGGSRARAGLVITEVALALVLLIGSGLAIRSFQRLMHVDAGFDPANVLTFRVSLPQSYDPHPDDPTRIGAPPRIAAFYQGMVDRMEQIPGVRSAGATSSLPLQGENWTKFFVPLDRPLPVSVEAIANVQYCGIAGHFFKANGVRLLKGRLLDEHDHATSALSVVVNEALVRTYWPGQDAIGKQVLLTPPDNLIPIGEAPPGYHVPHFTIVGVVSDAHYGGLDKNPKPAVYASVLQHDFSSNPAFTVRADGDPKNLVSAIRNVGLAMLLAAVGIYGVMSYTVAQRTSEIGIRMALGALRFDVLNMVLWQGLRLAAIGLAIGLALAFAVTRVMSKVLFGISATDPATFAVIAVLLAAVAALACYIPARRATKVDPMVALRYE